jgi:hypothetical protein
MRTHRGQLTRVLVSDLNPMQTRAHSKQLASKEVTNESKTDLHSITFNRIEHWLKIPLEPVGGSQKVLVLVNRVCCERLYAALALTNAKNSHSVCGPKIVRDAVSAVVAFSISI